MSHPNRRALRRFFLQLTVLDSGCWRWDGSRNSGGYGSLSWNYHKAGAHRLAYWWFVRKPQSDEEIDHLCRNRWCVNPAHLEAVSHLENMRRAHAAISIEERERRRRAQYQLFLSTSTANPVTRRIA